MTVLKIDALRKKVKRFSRLILLSAVFVLFLPAVGVWAAADKPVQKTAVVEKQTPPPTVLDHLKELSKQTTTPIRTEQIDRAGEKIGDRIKVLSKKISPFLGNWINSELFWGITWLKLIFCCGIFLFVLLFERLVHFFIKRRLGVKGETAASTTWFSFFLRGVTKPFSLFLWVYGTYGALSPLFSHFEQPGLPQLLHGILKWCTDVGGTVVALWFLYRLFHLVDFQIKHWAGSRQASVSTIVFSLSKHLRRPANMLILLVFFRLAVPLFDPGEKLEFLTGQAFGLLFISGLTWLMVQGLNALEEIVLSYYDLNVVDNLQARKMHTQVRFLKRFAITLVAILAGGSMLMVFDKVRQLGTSILASAGIIGIVVGLAAQRSISNILVGLQIALTQPIRLDDVVIIENEWGRIEEITMTFVVVRIWDLRRLIVPTAYFTEKPFQNWTRVSSELLGTVFLYLDYTVPVEAIREELQRVLQASPLWNGKVGQVQVTNTSAQSMELRLLLSTDDASKGWDLRCEVREKMIAFVQRNYPQSLPKMRAQMQGNTPESMAVLP